jgi:FtsP/CotA-like multicopper oxidase with cupredoxin domain
MSFRCFVALVAVLALGCAGSAPPSHRILSNDNLVAAGHVADGAWTVRLEIREGDWYPEGDSGLSEPMLAFAEPGRAPQIPGPLVRVPAGTLVRATILNRSGDSLLVHGLGARGAVAADSLVLSPGEQARVEFTADAPGTWFYWAGPPGATIKSRQGRHSQLAGALVVDSAGMTTPADRIFVLGEWNQPIDTTGPKPWVPRDVMTINGRMWPYTERFNLVQGDSVHWRWLNPSSVNHPMHLHGFYYDVRSKGDWREDTLYSAPDVRKVVTETLMPGQTMTMAWRAEEPGNWLFHCHFAFHVSHFLSLHKIPDPDDPGGPDAMKHAQHMMAGIVLGLHVEPKPGSGPAVSSASARRIRITPRELPPKREELYHYYVQGDGIAPRDSANSTIVHRRGEPVQITIVNRLRAPTAIHWHGIELTNSYVDGVPGWSGTPGHLAPSIAPGDSFTLAFTPPRAGTFMYHSHANEVHQIVNGMYGAIIVADELPLDPAHDRLFVVNGDFDIVRLNGTGKPATERMMVGQRYRLRLINIHGGHPFNFSLESDAGRLTWKPVAKDGADLPPPQAITQPASIFMGPGEVADFEFTPAAAGSLRLEVVTPSGNPKLATPIEVR